MCDGCNSKQETKELQVKQEKQERPIASEIIKEKTNTIKLLIIALLIQSAMSAAVAWKAIDFISGYEFESVEVNAEAGTAIYQNSVEGDNNIYGQDQSKNGKTQRD